MTLNMKVYTYFNPLPGFRDVDAERRLIALWERSWLARGWEPVVLIHEDLRHLPGFDTYLNAYWLLPTEYGHEYESLCFMRWWAVGQVAKETCVMSDYDVINYSLPPPEPDGKMTLITDPPPHGSSMGVVLGEPWQFTEMATLMRDWVPDEHDINRGATHGGKLHCSDASMVARMFDNKNREKPPWFVKAEGSRIFGEPGWLESPLVHYGYRMFHDGHWPKCDHIEKLRPI